MRLRTYTVEYASTKKKGSYLNERIVVIIKASAYLFQHFWKEMVL